MSQVAGQPYQPPQNSSSGGGSTMKIILIVLGILAAGCLCCVVSMFAISYFGMGAANKEIHQQVKDVPAVKREFGDIPEGGVEMSIMGTAEFLEEHNEYGQVVVVNVDGSKQSGKLILRQMGNEFEVVAIETEDGQLIDLEGQDLEDINNATLEEAEDAAMDGSGEE